MTPHPGLPGVIVAPVGEDLSGSGEGVCTMSPKYQGIPYPHLGAGKPRLPLPPQKKEGYSPQYMALDLGKNPKKVGQPA